MTLEQLLNRLLKLGWKPFGNKKIKEALTSEKRINLLNEKVNKVSQFKNRVAFSNWVLIFDEINIRELVSQESWLRQFVCEKEMAYQDDEFVEFKWYALVDVDWWAIAEHETWCRYLYSNIEPEYWIMESALCDEDKLEEFLLDNIKIKWS